MFHGRCFTGYHRAVPPLRLVGSEPPRSGPLADPNLDLAARLVLVLQALAMARAELTEAQATLAALEQDGAAEGPQGRRKIATARAAVRTAYVRWHELTKDADELAERCRRARTSTDHGKLYAETLRQLREEFDGGPHYELLCERVAGLHVRLQEMEQAGRAYPPTEHARLNAQLLAYVNQLQKYTETMKSESISREAQGVAEKILMIVEKNLATSYPELWRGVMREVRLALEQAA